MHTSITFFVLFVSLYVLTPLNAYCKQFYIIFHSDLSTKHTVPETHKFPNTLAVTITFWVPEGRHEVNNSKGQQILGTTVQVLSLRRLGARDLYTPAL